MNTDVKDSSGKSFDNDLHFVRCIKLTLLDKKSHEIILWLREHHYNTIAGLISIKYKAEKKTILLFIARTDIL